MKFDSKFVFVHTYILQYFNGGSKFNIVAIYFGDPKPQARAL